LNLFRLILRHPIAPIVWIVLTLAGIPFVIFGAASLEHSIRISSAFRATEGVVIANELIPSAEGGASYVPIVQFSLSNKSYTFQDVSGTIPPEFTNGQSVRVLYDPLNPYKAVVDTWARRWLAGTILSGVGIILMAAGFLTAAFISRRG